MARVSRRRRSRVVKSSVVGVLSAATTATGCLANAGLLAPLAGFGAAVFGDSTFAVDAVAALAEAGAIAVALGWTTGVELRVGAACADCVITSGATSAVGLEASSGEASDCGVFDGIGFDGVQPTIDKKASSPPIAIRRSDDWRIFAIE